MRVLFKNIKQLLQVRESNVHKVSGREMGELPLLEDAYLITENDSILDYGRMDELPGTEAEIEKKLSESDWSEAVKDRIRSALRLNR